MINKEIPSRGSQLSTGYPAMKRITPFAMLRPPQRIVESFQIFTTYRTSAKRAVIIAKVKIVVANTSLNQKRNVVKNDRGITSAHKISQINCSFERNRYITTGSIRMVPIAIATETANRIPYSNAAKPSGSTLKYATKAFTKGTAIHTNQPFSQILFDNSQK